MTNPANELREENLYIDLAPEVSHRISAREGVLTNRLQMKAGEIVGLKELLDQHSTHLVERLKKAREVHRHNSIPCLTDNADEGCVICIKNNALDQAIDIVKTTI